MELNQDLIEEGRALVVKCETNERMTCEARFELGRWVNKVVPQNTGNNQYTSTATTVGELMKLYADAIGCSPKTLEQYRDIVLAWGSNDPAGLSWTVARRLAYRTDKMEIVSAVFDMFGKVTPKTIEDYETALREENKRREQMLQPVDEVIDYEDDEWEEDEEETIAVPPPISITSGPRKHGFSAPVRKLFSLVEMVKDTRNTLREEGIAESDIANDENYEEVLTAVDTAITEMMSYREALTQMRVRAGLSPEIS